MKPKTGKVASPDALRYADLLLSLQQLMIEGQGSSEKAGQLRDEAISCWERLSVEYQQELSDLSGDLYLIEGREVLSPSLSPSFIDVDRSELYASLLKNKQYFELLDHLRRMPRNEPDDRIAYYRYRCWSQPNFPNVALAFLEFALRRDRTNITYRLLHFGAMWAAGRIEDAEKAALRVIHSDEPAPILVYAAAHTLIRMATKREGDVTREIYPRLIDAMERVVPMLSEGKTSSQLPKLARTGIHLLLGTLYKVERRFDDAIASFEQALASSPNDPHVLAARGMLWFRLDSPFALEDLQAAVKAAPNLLWPRAFLAATYLRNSQYDACAKVCNELLVMEDGGGEFRRIVGDLLNLAASRINQQAHPVAFTKHWANTKRRLKAMELTATLDLLPAA